MKTIVVIESNGGLSDTRVATSDGRDLSRLLLSVQWEARASNYPEATIRIIGTPVAVRGRVEKIEDAHGNRIRRIVYEDGTELSAED